MDGWTDTHCHLDAAALAGDGAGVIARARDAGVRRIIVPGIAGAVRNPGWPAEMVRIAWGVHPFHAAAATPASIIAAWKCRGYEPVAVGECGLDVHAEVALDHQAAVFETQAGIARSAGLPLLVHLRGAWQRALEILRRHAEGVPWVMHAFSGPVEIAHPFLAEGAVISFAGSLCMPQARKTPAVARMVPDDRFVLETDSPDLKPFFFEAACNEPAALPGIGRYLAGLRGVSAEQVRLQSAATAVRIFGRG
ncbi:MAG TPA: TatD family hydrolase [Candidatus Ozemobacteraceae bacterium]|nr:TatD family hydrolase [Candidatus Ozemobacteraceae bacterium]